jgi:hypothetical protein
LPALSQALPVHRFSLDAPDGWLGSFLISFSDRRVLGELHPDSTQSARDRQSIHHWPVGDSRGAQTSSVSSLPRQIHNRPKTSSKSISGKTHRRLASPWPPLRLALQLEAHFGPSTILSNVSRQPEHLTLRNEKLPAIGRSTFALGSQDSRQTFREISTTTWQKN